VHEVRRQRTGLEDLFARLTEADQNGTELSDVDDELGALNVVQEVTR
jgi:ABC-2 type transport system ATP-binding protein